MYPHDPYVSATWKEKQILEVASHKLFLEANFIVVMNNNEL